MSGPCYEPQIIIIAVIPIETTEIVANIPTARCITTHSPEQPNPLRGAESMLEHRCATYYFVRCLAAYL